MQLYDNIKENIGNIGQTLKYTGLVTTFYLTTSFLSQNLFAQETKKPESKPANPDYSLEEITDIYQQYNIYLRKFCSDNILDYDEIVKLHNFLDEKADGIQKPENDISEYINRKKENMKKEREEKEKENDLSEYKKGLNQIFEKIRNNIMPYYPGLFGSKNNKLNLIYSSNEELSARNNELLSQYINEASAIFDDVGLDTLILSEWNDTKDLTVRDLVVFTDIIKSTQIKNINYTQSAKLTKLNNLPKELPDLKKHKEVYENFLWEVKKWKEGRLTNKKFTSVSILSLIEHKAITSECSDEADDIENIIKDYFGKDNSRYKDIYVKNIGKQFPVKTKLPLWLGITLGLCGPFITKALSIVYTGRKNHYGEINYDSADGIEMTLNSLVGTIFLDGIHPLIFPLRILLTPIVTEKLRSLID